MATPAELKKERTAKWKRENPEKVKAAWKRWYANNGQAVKAKFKARYSENPALHRRRSAAWRKNNLEKARERDRQRRIANPEKAARKDALRYWSNTAARSIENKTWRKNNALKLRDYRNRYTRSRRALQPEFKLLTNLRTRIVKVLAGTNKSAKTIELLGCSIPQLREHLESRFKPGMNWDNHGPRGWHVDHIRPCASFDLSDAKQQRECFHFSNLQPLWWNENLAKRAAMFGTLIGV